MGKKHASQYANFGWLRMNLLQSIAKAEEEAEMLPAC